MVMPQPKPKIDNSDYPLTCTGCGKPITKEEAKMYGDRCMGCWYDDAQERTLNEEINVY